MHSWADGGGTSEEASGQTSSSSRRGRGSDGDGEWADGASQSDSAARETALRRCLRMCEVADKADEEDGEGEEEEAEMEDIVGLGGCKLCGGMIFGKGEVVCFISMLQRPGEIINPLWRGYT